MVKINLSTVRIFGEKYALDTILVIFFGPLMASGMIDAWRFCKTIALTIPVIVSFLYKYCQQSFERHDYLDMQSISIE